MAAPLLRVVDDLPPEVLHDTTQYGNNRIECDHGRLKARLRPMRGLRTDRTASTVIRGHAFIQNLRRGHYQSRSRIPPRASTRRGSIRPTQRFDLTTQPTRHRPAAPSDQTTQQCPGQPLEGRLRRRIGARKAVSSQLIRPRRSSRYASRVVPEYPAKKPAMACLTRWRIGSASIRTS